jgi:hypothetical protein
MKNFQSLIFGLLIVGAFCAAAYLWKYEEWVAIPRAREPMVAFLKDPTSAEFRNEKITKSGVLCGEVNSKNSMGGYVGFKRYIAAGPQASYIEDVGHLGPSSHVDIMQMLDEETAIAKRFVKARAEFPDLPVPSESERADMARKSFFETRWKELCA